MFEQKERIKFTKVFTAVFVVSVAIGAFIYYITTFYNPNIGKENQIYDLKQQMQAPQTSIAPRATAVPQSVLSGTELIAGIPVAQSVAKSATQGVVGVTVERVAAGKLFDRNKETQVGVGSGVIVSSDGYILTNNHVAGGKSKRIIVSLADGRNVDGETVWSDPVLDLAVVKINLTGLPALKLGDAEQLQVGEPAIAIGNPLGLEFQRTVTSGIISALNRTISIETDQGTNYMEDLIQTDASINPGNSGGPLLNSRGEVVGINTIKVTSAEAIGFAIPINAAKPIVSRFLSTGRFTESYMGVFAYDKALLPYIDGNLNINQGVYVAHIDENGPAYKAGLRLGCIIKQIDGQDINSMMQLRTILFSKSPGDTINVTHLMHGKDQWVTVPVILAAKEKDGLVTR
ncbi:MAG: trypsin-like serine protease [Ruminiclostridium sp.]|nr:trypsin-like serine protease [Ruminiclostridium sp.]